MKLLLKLSPSLQRGDGNIYVLFIIVAIMGISYFLVDGFVPFLNKSADNYKVVTLDTNESAQDKRSNLQLTTFTYKPTLAPIITTTPGTTTCTAGRLALFLVLDRSGSLVNLKPDLVSSTQSIKTRMLQSSGDNAVSMISFGTQSTHDVVLDSLKINGNAFSQAINAFTPRVDGTLVGNTFRYLDADIAKAQNLFPQHKRVVIYISDGDFQDTSNVFNDAPRIRNSGSEVYFLRVVRGPYSLFKSEIEAFASIPASNYVFDINPDGSDINGTLDRIFNEECK